MTCVASVLPTPSRASSIEVDGTAPGRLHRRLSARRLRFDDLARRGRDVDLVRRIRAITTRLGGSLVVIGCDPELKRQIDVFGDPPPAFDLMRRVKQQFDPNGILSPGRFVGRL